MLEIEFNFCFCFQNKKLLKKKSLLKLSDSRFPLHNDRVNFLSGFYAEISGNYEKICL